MKAHLILFCLLAGFSTAGQEGDRIFHPNIRTVKLHPAGDQTGFAAITLNSSDVLELHFDDLDANVKSYYYSFQLCNADWTPSLLTTFEYTTGFQNMRITNYRNSSISSIRYTHYQATVPDRSSLPKKSGNYILRVFLNGDPKQTAFTKRFVVAENKASIATQLQQPFNATFFRSHQKLQIAVTTDSRIRLFSPQDLKVVVLQNNNWQSSLFLDRPTISRGNYYEYSDEAYTAMPAGKEWRWIDLRSFRLMSDRMQKIDTRRDTTEVFVKPDGSRNGLAYVYYRDVNGTFVVETMESVNPFWQGDYGLVHFTYMPPNNLAFEGRDVLLFGELTQYGADPSARMQFNQEKGVYEKTLLLKQGFYNYSYVTVPHNKQSPVDYSVTEGNYWGTENSYVVLIYYRPFGARADELIGYTTISSIFQRQGF